METLLIVAVVALAVVALLLGWQLSVARSLRAPAGHTPNDLDKKVESLKGELAGAKEDLNRKQKQLEELREEAKKKLRREGKKMEREEEKAAGSDPRDVEIQGLKKGMSALESQLNAAKRELDGLRGDTERVKNDVRSEAEGAVRARDDERNRSRTLAEENQALKRTLEELRAARKKESERPDLPGTALDLKALPTEVVQELARYFRKGEEFERLYHVTQGQSQIEKDRYQELQRRYFAVCRELALAAGQTPTNDLEARAAAEAAVAGSDQVSRAVSQRTQPAAAGTPSPLGPDGQKKRRRRRRRRGGAPGLPGAAAAAEGTEADDGDEGDDHEGGDEGGDEGASESAALDTTPPASTPSSQAPA